MDSFSRRSRPCNYNQERLDPSGSLVVETPLGSPVPFNPRGGNNPWMIDGDSSSVLYVKNAGAERSRYIASIRYPGGEYMIGLKEVGPGETSAIDFRRLRDDQVPDVTGHALPRELLSGQVLWTWHSGAALVGRVNTMSLSKGLASNMSCGRCCDCPSTASISLSPFSSTGPVGGFVQEVPWETDSDNCNGPRSFPLPPSWVTWSSSNTAVAPVDSSGMVSCLSSGFAQIAGNGTVSFGQIDNSREPGSDGCFFCVQVNAPSEGDADVTVVPTITGPDTVWYFGGANPAGYQTSITLRSDGGPSTTWTVTAGANKVNLSTTTGSQTTVTSTGTAFSSSLGDIKITATAAVASSAPFAITSRTPNRLLAGQTVHQCDPTFGYIDFLNYTIQDNLLTSLPADVPLNERWSTGVVNDYNGTNWRRGAEGTFTATGSSFADMIGGEALSLPPVPVPACVGDATAVQHWGQEWRIGSLTIGVGRRVQIDKLQKFVNHGEHQQIVTPAP